MPLALTGVSHHTAPVEVRERFAYGSAEALDFLGRLREGLGVEEAVLLSTCNRTEVYVYPVLDRALLDAVERLLGEQAGSLPQPAPRYLYRREGEAVARHLFRVTSGLDSLVLGEAEIQGQVRDAYLRSAEGVSPTFTGSVLDRLFQSALAVGGRVRDETTLGEGNASVASVGVDLAGKIFGDLEGRRVLVLGAGETGELVVRSLARLGVEGVVVANRTYQRAEDLAQRLRGRAVALSRTTEALREADIVVASTAAPHPVLTSAAFQAAFPRGRKRPLLVIDLAIPRDVEPALGDEPNVFLYNVDDLQKILHDGLDRRRGAVGAAEALARDGAREFQAWYRGLEVVPVVRALREGAHRTRGGELERLLARMEHWTEEDRAAVEAFSRQLMNKWLHEPTVRLREGAGEGRGSEVLEAARLLFGIDPGGPRVGRGPAAPPDRGDDDHERGT